MTVRGAAERFTDRVANYVAYRPQYPAGVFAVLRDELGLSALSIVADVGAGTGILTELLLRAGGTVFAVEPNAAMREAAEVLLRVYPNFHSVDGTAEGTTLPGASIDLVTAGQAFHWFNADATRIEFARILKPGGMVALVWNMRRTEATPFLRDYESLLREFGTDYSQVNCEQLPEARIAQFFLHGYQQRLFDNAQDFDFAGLRGRLLSSSYVPSAGHPNYELLLAELRRLFDAHQQGGRVRIEYDTRLYFGHPA